MFRRKRRCLATQGGLSAPPMSLAAPALSFFMPAYPLNAAKPVSAPFVYDQGEGSAHYDAARTSQSQLPHCDVEAIPCLNRWLPAPANHKGKRP